MNKKRAVVLLSGGLDSTTCLACAKEEGFECYTLGFDYGQKHAAEIKAAERISKFFGAKRHEIIRLPLGNIVNSALTQADLEVPEYKLRTFDSIPITYVPARNTVFLAIALGWAEVLMANSIFIGVSSVDYSGYPDCRPAYIQAFQQMANLATKSAVESSTINIVTPLIHLTKAETIKLGLSLGVDYSITLSCYQATAEGLACGKCESCYFRKKGFQEAGVPDLTAYR